MKKSAVYTFLGLFALLGGCSKSTEQQMREYIEFYYPTTGQYTYQILFDWGEYLIWTGPDAGDELHPDSEPYRGYITMRPSIPETPAKEKLLIFLITPTGQVWTSDAHDAIGRTKTREEVTTEKNGPVTSTSTVTINSPAEPIIDHFKAHPSEWTRYGTVKAASGDKAEFTLG